MISYRNSQGIHSDDDDSEDSDKECSIWKRADKVENCTLQNVEVEEKKSSELVQCKKRKRNTIWSDILQDQLISEDLGSCLLKNKPVDYGNRGHESYDYTLKYTLADHKIDMECSMSDDEISCKSETNSMVSSETNSVVSSKKNFKSNKFVKLDSAGRAAANKIVKILNEKKAYLIYRVVKEIGIEKAMTLLNMTEQIEERGGMMTVNNARRRTPGGVYFQLLKSDKDITKEMIDKVFEGEMSSVQMKKFYAEKNKKRKALKKMRKQVIKMQEGEMPKNILMQKTDASENVKMPETEAVLGSDQIISDAVSGMDCSSEANITTVPILKRTDSDLEDGELKSDDDSFN